MHSSPAPIRTRTNALASMCTSTKCRPCTWGGHCTADVHHGLVAFKVVLQKDDPWVSVGLGGDGARVEHGERPSPLQVGIAVVQVAVGSAAQLVPARGQVGVAWSARGKAGEQQQQQGPRGAWVRACRRRLGRGWGLRRQLRRRHAACDRVSPPTGPQAVPRACQPACLAKNARATSAARPTPTTPLPPMGCTPCWFDPFAATFNQTTALARPLPHPPVQEHDGAALQGGLVASKGGVLDVRKVAHGRVDVQKLLEQDGTWRGAGGGGQGVGNGLAGVGHCCGGRGQGPAVDAQPHDGVLDGKARLQAGGGTATLHSLGGAGTRGLLMGAEVDEPQDRDKHLGSCVRVCGPAKLVGHMHALSVLLRHAERLTLLGQGQQQVGRQAGRPFCNAPPPPSPAALAASHLHTELRCC